MPKQNWRRKLARPMHVRKHETLNTLGDARHFVLEVIPVEHQQHKTWQHVAGLLLTAADGGDVLDATIALEIALMLGGVRTSVPSPQ